MYLTWRSTVPRYTVMSDERKLEIINQLLSEIRNYVDSETGIRIFPVSKIARDMGLTWREIDWALKQLKQLGLIENLGSAGKSGAKWRVDISERMVKPEDLHSSRADINSTAKQSLVRQLKAERGKVARLNFGLAKRDTTISNLEAEIAKLRETIQDELITSLVIFLQEQMDSQ